MLTDEEIHSIIKKYFDKPNGLTDHQISSYNELIDTILPNQLSLLFPLTINVNNENIDTIVLSISNIDIKYPYYTENNGCSNIMTGLTHRSCINNKTGHDSKNYMVSLF